MPVVIDASITMAWCFDDEASERTDALLVRVASEGAVTPPHWSVEVTNALLMGERRQRSSPIHTGNVLIRLDSLPITVDDAPAARTTILALARAHRLTAYDAAYLELALRLTLPLATLDAELRDACGSAKVPLLP